jgi:4-hydroxybenzoate polyprenyltransferase
MNNSMNRPLNNPSPAADAVKGSWVNRFAPDALKPYLWLMRADRPIGWWLLLWPCWWSLALAGAGVRTGTGPHQFYLYALFMLGAIVMRGAGCAYNDIVDRDFDARVERTRSRPIPSGAVSVRKAWAFTALLGLIGLLVLLQLGPFAIILGLASLAIVALYPFMKRFTYWPQIVLGLAFNWGALMGWATLRGSLSLAPLALYLGGICWTLGYDTIYAHQDKQDDILIGVKSTALRFGPTTKIWLWGFYGAAFFMFLTAGMLAKVGILFYPLMVFAAAHLIHQIITVDISSPDSCLKHFRANRDFGWIVFMCLLAGQIF